MKKHIQAFSRELAPPSVPFSRIEYPQLSVRLAIPDGWNQVAPFAFSSPDESALIVFTPLQLRGPMDAHAAAAVFSEASGLQMLAYRQLGSRDDAETLCRPTGSQTKLTLLRVLTSGPKTWAVRAHWDIAAESATDMATLRTSVRSFHGDAAVQAASSARTFKFSWEQKEIVVPCPAGWHPVETQDGESIQLHPDDRGDAFLRIQSLPPGTPPNAVFTIWRTALERLGFMVFGAPITREPGSPTSTVPFKAEKSGQLFDAPAALSEFADGSLLLSFLAPAWSTSPETAALTQRAFADFALAIEDALRRA